MDQAEAEQAIDDLNPTLLLAAIRFNAITLGLVWGAIGAFAVFTATYVSLLKWGDSAGSYLNLLAIFFPGYSASEGGALIGAFWAFTFGFLGGGITYWLYGRVLMRRILQDTECKATDDPVFKPKILRFYGVSLGIAIGSVAAGAFFSSTLWLVIRGDADNSVHAALLSNYLPGYTVTVTGGLVGAAQLFILVFLACLLLGGVYNKVLDLRQQGAL